MSARNGTGSISRRWFLRLAGVHAGALALAACGAAQPPTTAPSGSATQTSNMAQAPADAKDVTLNLIWAGWIIDQNPVVNDLVAQYADETGVKIKADKAPDDLDQKVLLEAQQGRSTWGGYEGHSNTSTAPLVEGDAITEWDPFLTQDDLDDLYDTSKQEMEYKGRKYHFPFRVSPVLLGVWPKTLEQVGVTEPPTSWDQVHDIAARVKQDLSTSSAPFFGYGFTAEANYGLWATLATLTRTPFDTERGLADLDQPAAVEAMRILHSLYPYSPPEGLDLTGLTNTMMTGQMALVQVHVVRAGRADAKFHEDFRIARLPKSAESESTNYWSSGATIFKHYATPDLHAEVAKFWLWLSQQKALFDTMWVKNGSPPNRKSLQKLFEPMKGKEIDAGYWDLFEQQEISQPKPASLVLGIQEKYVASEVANLMNGQHASPEEAIAAIKQQTADEVAKQGLE